MKDQDATPTENTAQQQELKKLQFEMGKLRSDTDQLAQKLKRLRTLRQNGPIIIYVTIVIISLIAFVCLYKDLDKDSIPHLITLLVAMVGYISLLLVGVFLWHVHSTKVREYAHLEQLERDAIAERQALRENQPPPSSQPLGIKDLIALLKALEINDTKKPNEKEKEQINQIRRDILKKIQNLTSKVFEEIK